MNDDIAQSRLAAVPADIRKAMMADRANLPAGSVSVMNRFFVALAAENCGDQHPSERVFTSACASESTLALLLTTLERYAPDVDLSAGRILRRAYYRTRSGGSQHSRAKAPRSKNSTQPRGWPAEWLDLLPRLEHAPIRQSSRDRYVASINRCAELMPGLRCPPRLGWLLASALAEALLQSGLNERSTAYHIAALIALGQNGGIERPALHAMRQVHAGLVRKGRRLPKRKTGRITTLYDHGGYGEILRVVRVLLDHAESLPSWRAEAETARATAAILSVAVNMPARTGDMASWVIGDHLTRSSWGEWQLRWCQQKTGHELDAGLLWREVGEVLDQHILGGRPGWLAQQRYDALSGKNWLTLRATGYASRWPSERVKDAIGVPLHDLRTMAADYLRLHNPATAPGIVAALLGHRNLDTQDEYRALCTDTVAQQSWQGIRAQHAVRIR